MEGVIITMAQFKMNNPFLGMYFDHDGNKTELVEFDIKAMRFMPTVSQVHIHYNSGDVLIIENIDVVVYNTLAFWVGNTEIDVIGE
jgi:hypothetical protein